MKNLDPHIYLAGSISGVAVLLALGHLIFPSVKIDSITIALLVIAILPWLGSIFRSIELPGGLKVTYPELERARQESEKAGLLATPVVQPPTTADIAIAREDPNLALASLRIEIERRLRTLAEAQGLRPDNVTFSRLLRMLNENGVISNRELSFFRDIYPLLSKAVHGATVEPSAAEWALEVGPGILGALDEKMTRFKGT